VTGGPDMPLLNSVGDLVLTDPQAMCALADPFRLTLLDRLRREGPATAAELAAHVQATRSVIDQQLQELERFGFVTRSDVASDTETTRWCAVSKGVMFEVPDDPEGGAAARSLGNAMLLNSIDLPRRWVAEDEPRLELDWVRAAGLFNARVTVTPDELRSIQEGLERLLEPFLTRESDDVPAEAGRVRILSYFMPEAAPGGPPSPEPPA
jgi:DNA-binding transcriptional ArsR family regulator